MMEMNVTGNGLVLRYYSSILLEGLHDKLVRLLSPGSGLEVKPSRYEAKHPISLFYWININWILNIIGENNMWTSKIQITSL
jgi:hypothetical protein